jgi:hypothetical protein
MNRNSTNNSVKLIATLSISAALMALAHAWIDPTPAVADVVKDRDFQLITLTASVGGETLGVIDNRTGLIAFFQYDEGRRAIIPRSVRALSDAFIETPAAPERRR